MDKNEFLEFLRKTTEDFAAAKNHQQAFIKKLAKDLQTIVFEHYPEYQTNTKKARDFLSEQTKQCAQKVIDALNLAVDHQNKGLPYNTRSKPAKPQTLAEGEKELQELIDFFPNEDLEFIKQVHWDSFNETQRPAQFHTSLHNKSKEILVEFYEDTILELNADGLRHLDSTVFYLAICPFVDTIFESEHFKE